MAYIGSIKPQSLSTNLGQQAGASLGNVLTSLAEHKLGKLQQAYSEKQLEGAGYDKQTAKLLSMYGQNPQVQAQAVKSQLAAPSERENARLLEQLFNPGASQQIQQQTQPQYLQQQQLQPMQRQENPQDQLAKLLSNPVSAARLLSGGQMPQQQEQPQEMQQFGQPQQQQVQQQPNAPVTPGRLNAKQFGDLAKLNIDLKKERRAEQAQEIETQKFLKPILEEHRKDLGYANQLYSTSREALDILEKHEKEFPGTIKSYLPEEFHRNPHVREYASKLNKIVTMQVGAAKGNQTNFKAKLVQLQKPNLNQPIATQKALLKSNIKEAESVFERDKQLAKIKEESNGRYPIDLADAISEQVGYANKNKQAQEVPAQGQSNVFDKLPPASELPGKRMKFPDGSIRRSNGTKWVKE